MSPSTAPPVQPPAGELDARLRSLFQRTAAEIALPSPRSARAAVRRRLARLQRRRRLRHALGTSTLAAGIVAGAGPLRPGTTASVSAPPGTEAGTHDDGAPAPTQPPLPSPSPPAPPPRPAPPRPVPAENPIWSWDAIDNVARPAADPGALHAAGLFHVYTTSSEHCVSGDCRQYWVPRFTSPELAEPGRLSRDAMPVRPAWVDPDDRVIWAPSVARIGDRFVLYFAATSGRPRDGGMKCLGAAVSAGPEGPFVPLDEPLRCTPGYWAIDPYPVYASGVWHLLWRQDDAAHTTGRIVAAPLGPNGLAIVGDLAHTLVVGEFPWEEGYPIGEPGIGPIENPAMVRHPATGEWLLTWSANLWQTGAYATGLAICDGPLGPCRRMSQEAPWVRGSTDPGLATTAELSGIGGLSFVTGPDGQAYAVLHGYAGAAPTPGSRRVAWTFRVEAVPGTGYRLVDVRRNLSAAPAVYQS
jgi:hypothetical protein